MRLRYLPTSPYARKILVLAIEAGLDERIERLTTNPTDDSPDFLSENPLGKVPCLATDDGEFLYDSPVICEYLDSRHDGAKLFPPPGPERWRALRRQALGDGILDAAVLRRYEGMRPEAQRSPEWVARQKDKVTRALDALEREAASGALEGPPNIGHLTVGCALGYLDLRYPEDAWRTGRPALAAWYAAFAERPSMKRTAPPPGS
jgi:glutathione S-transferase